MMETYGLTMWKSMANTMRTPFKSPKLHPDCPHWLSTAKPQAVRLSPRNTRGLIELQEVVVQSIHAFVQTKLASLSIRPFENIV